LEKRPGSAKKHSARAGQHPRIASKLKNAEQGGKIFQNKFRRDVPAAAEGRPSALRGLLMLGGGSGQFMAYINACQNPHLWYTLIPWTVP
jgi:hypothetical protein